MIWEQLNFVNERNFSWTIVSFRKKDHIMKTKNNEHFKFVQTISKIIVLNKRFLVLADPQSTLVDLNGTVGVIWSYSQCYDCNAEFTTVPLKPYSGQVWNRYQRINFENWTFSVVVSLQTWIAHFYFRKIYMNF